MKTNIALMGTVIALGLAGCSTPMNASKLQQEKASIEAAFAQLPKLRSEQERLGPLSDKPVSELMTIDVRRCPKDFRSTWFDYLITVESLHKRVARVTIIARAEGRSLTNFVSLIKFGVRNPVLGRYLLAGFNREDRALEKVERSAMNYGVMPEPWPAANGVSRRR